MIYLDTASFGLPPARVVEAVRADVERWAAGEARAPSYDAPVDAARASYARLLSVPVDGVAIDHFDLSDRNGRKLDRARKEAIIATLTAPRVARLAQST